MTKLAWRRRAWALLLTVLIVPLGALAAYEPPPTNPFAEARERAERWYTIEGEVEERVPAGPYLYLRVRSAEAEHWVVALKGTVPTRRDVRMTVLGHTRDFHSARLGRDFDELLFVVVRGRTS
jgi:hypothetical protein